MSEDWKRIYEVVKRATKPQLAPQLDGMVTLPEPLNSMRNILADAFRYVSDSIASYYNELTNTYSRSVEHLQKENIGDAYKELMPLVTLSLMVGGVLDFAQTKLAGSGLDLKFLSDKLTQIFNVDQVVIQSSTQPFVEKLSRAFQRIVNKRIQDYIPDPTLLIRAWFKGYISDQKLKEYLYMYAIPDWVQQILIDFTDFTPTPFQIERILRYKEPDQKTLTSWLKENAIPEAEIPWWLDYYKRVIIKDEFDRFLSRLADAYVDGFISKDRFEEILIKFNKTQDERIALFTVLNIVKDRQIRELRAKKAIEMFRRDLLTCEELHKKLTELYDDAEIAQAVTEYECIKRGILYGKQ